MWVTVPLVLKPRLSWFADWMFPLPETVDCTTPYFTVVVRVLCPLDGDAGPTAVYATMTSAMQPMTSRLLRTGCSLNLLASVGRPSELGSRRTAAGGEPRPSSRTSSVVGAR